MCKVTTLIQPKKAVTATKKTQRKVQFGRVSARVFTQTLTKADKRTMWYNGSDFKAMNKQVRHTLNHELYYGFDPNDTERTWRGLEHVREGVPNIKMERRRSFVRSFLHVYKTMGVQDPDELGAMVSSESQVDRTRAQSFADFDAYEASCVYHQRQTYSWDSYHTPNHHHQQQQKQQEQQKQRLASQAEDEAAKYYKEFCCDLPSRTQCPKPVQTIIVARAS